MDFSSSIDDSCEKSRRVRSWYLYEQFKSIERDQLDAAQKLKNKSYQDRVLRQELSERRARRRLCDQFGLCQSESRLDRSIKNSASKDLLSTSADDLYENFCKLHTNNDVGDILCSSSRSSTTYQECKVTMPDPISNVNSIASIIKDTNYDDNLTDNIKEDLQSVRRNITDNINLQLETVKENIEYIEKYTKMYENGNIVSEDSFDCSDESIKDKNKKNAINAAYKSKVYNVLTIWSKLVDFSYKNMQLTTGNCYNDYSTQLLVTIIACDIIRHSINRMCKPYVSPVQFARSELSIDTEKCLLKTRYNYCKKHKAKPKVSQHMSHKYNAIKRNLCSRNRCFSSRRTKDWKPRGRSEPWNSVAKFLKHGENSSSSIWPEDIKASAKLNCKCHKIEGVVQSMMQLSRHLNDVLREVRSVDCT